MRALHDLPQAPVATDAEVMSLIESRQLNGLGIGYIDAHLLASALLAADAMHWTRDLRLRAVAANLSLAAPFG